MTARETRVPADSVAAAAARRFVVDSGVVPEGPLDDVVLLVSELASNAVKHARATSIGIRISRSGSTLRVDIEDDGPGFEDPTSSPPRRGSGMGLRLVGELADRWGIDTGDSTTVWFEMDRVDR